MKKNFGEPNPFEKYAKEKLSPLSESLVGSPLETEFPSLYSFAEMAEGLTLNVKNNPWLEKMCQDYKCVVPEVVSFSSQGRQGNESVQIKFFVYIKVNRREIMSVNVRKTAKGVKVSTEAPINLENDTFLKFAAPKLAEAMLRDLRVFDVQKMWHKGDMPFKILPEGQPLYDQVGVGSGLGMDKDSGVGPKEEITDWKRFAGWISAETTIAVFALEGEKSEKEKPTGRSYGVAPQVQKIQVDLGRHPDCYVILTRYGFVIESPKVGRAAYMTAFNQELSDDIVENLKSGSLSNKQIAKLLDDVGVVKYLQMTRAQLYAEPGFLRHIHVNHKNIALQDAQTEHFQQLLDVTLPQRCRANMAQARAESSRLIKNPKPQS